MQSVEVTGKTREEATKSAAEKLGVSVDQLEVTTLEEVKGLFGKTTVRIKADVKASVATEEAPAAKPKGRATKAKAAPAEAPVAEPEPVVEAAPEAPKARRGKKAAEPAAEATSAESADEPTAEAVATVEDGERLAALLLDLLAKADMNVTVVPGGVNGRYASLQLDGKDAAFLVGKHGEVLNALQYLVNIIGGRRFNNGVRATLDGNDYRKRREEQLTALATSIADQVKARGEEAVLDALPAFERRIVHKALGVITGITTYSEGEEPNRRVVIAPAD